MNLSAHFTLEEMTANSHGIVNAPDNSQVKSLILWCMNIGEPLRAHFKLPIIVTSGFRSPELNKAVGGADTSQHLKGEAVDFHIPGVANADIWRYIMGNLDFDQVIAEKLKESDGNAGWIHCSYKPKDNRHDCLSFLGNKYVKGLQFIGGL